jgi:hypothetical protein
MLGSIIVVGFILFMPMIISTARFIAYVLIIKLASQIEYFVLNLTEQDENLIKD